MERDLYGWCREAEDGPASLSGVDERTSLSVKGKV